LLKAKYCTWVAAALCTQKNTKKLKWPWPTTLKLNSVPEVVEVYVRAKFHQAKWSGSWVIVLTNLFALSRNGKESENPVRWLWRLTYDLKILWGSGGCCRSTRVCKISSSWVQRFISYHANRKKNSDENNTVRRYRADGNNNRMCTVQGYVNWVQRR